MPTVIAVEHLSKIYHLGQIGTGTFSRDLELWLARVRGKPNPFLKIGQADDGNRDAEEIWALRDVNLTIEQGEVLGIIGRNGAGKSTLLKILSRVTAPTSGRIRVKGRIASLLEVGTGFHPELTGRENIYLNGAILGMSRDEIGRKFDEIVDFSEVEKFIDTPVKRYSSGMYVRLAFAVAAHLDPEILVVDEVLAVGDAEFQKKCLGKMGDVAKEGRTVLFVSHNMAAVESLCERVILIRSGQIQESGLASDVIAKYLSESTSSEEKDLVELSLDNREGSGRIRFIRWDVRDDLLGLGRTVRMGQPCAFEIEYGSNNDPDLTKVEIALLIKDAFGKPLLTSATHFMNTHFEKVPTRGVFVCRFKSLPLLQNKYQVHISCEVNGVIADRLPNAGFFNVVESDVYGTGKVPNQKHGVFVIQDYEWDVNSVSV